MSVKKISFYLDDADITLRSDHLPLKRFLEKITLNSKVNNWAVETEQYLIKFEYIKGIKNTLVNTMSRLIIIDPDTCQDLEPEGQEYEYCIFEELPNVSMIKKVSSKVNMTLNEITVSSADLSVNLQLGVTCEQLCQLQQGDMLCKKIMSLLKSSELQNNNPYFMEDELLIRNMIGNKQCFHTMVLPQVLKTQIIRAAYDELGYKALLEHTCFSIDYYWKVLKASVTSILNSVCHIKRETYK